MRFLLTYLEIIFTVAGLGVIAAAAFVASRLNANVWEIAAITATAVGVIHGVLFWLVRRAQRLTRRKALEETQLMLRDIVNNQLAIIRMSSDMQAMGTASETAKHLESLQNSIDVIKNTLSDISEESLRRWKQRYNLPDSGTI